MKATEQYFPVVLFTKVVLNDKSVDEIKMKAIDQILCCGPVHYAVQQQQQHLQNCTLAYLECKWVKWLQLQSTHRKNFKFLKECCLTKSTRKFNLSKVTSRHFFIQIILVLVPWKENCVCICL